ncbi:MAG: hypothetical protein K2X35_12195 [Bryobacteraceae bacterium]|nr:hypothetical protein [Bryobacteraceae bacterium]
MKAAFRGFPRIGGRTGAAALAFLWVIWTPALNFRPADLGGTDSRYDLAAPLDRKQWDRERSRLRRTILSAAGLHPMLPRGPVRAAIAGTIPRAGYSIDRVWIETLPGFALGGNLYRPGRPGPHPAVLLAHGHFDDGRLEDTDDVSDPRLAANLALRGYVVFSYDMPGYNDTAQIPHEWGGAREQLWNFTPLGLQLFNSIRALDWLTSLKFVDRSRVAMTGASGGGTQTFLLAAVDDRIRLSAPVCMVSAHFQGGDVCENAPNLRLDANNPMFAAAAAPRPQLWISATGDWTKENPAYEFPWMRRVYELYRAEAQVRNAHFRAGHNYNRQSREALYAFLREKFGAIGNDQEREVAVPRKEELRVISDVRRNDAALEALFQTWRRLVQKQVKSLSSGVELRDLLSAATALRWPAKAEAVGRGNGLSIIGDDVTVPAELHEGRGDPVLLVHPGGAAEAAGRIAALRDSGRTVLAIDPFPSREDRRRRNSKQEFFLTFHRSDHARAIQEILVAARWLSERGRVRIVAEGEAGPWAVIAAAIAPEPVRVVADAGVFRDEDYVKHFFVPGLQRAGGMETARRILGRRWTATD